MGITFNLGILIAWFTFKSTISFTPILLYLSAIIWTIGYDTIYAYQDIIDDKAAGIKSLALKLGYSASNMIWKFYSVTFILLLIVALNTYMGVYFFIIFGIAAYIMHLEIETLDFKNTKDCLKKFNNNVLFGTLIFLALIFGKFY